MAAKPNYANENHFFFNISSNPRKNYFQHAVAKYKALTAVPSQKYRNSVKISSILENVPESNDLCKTSI